MTYQDISSSLQQSFCLLFDAGGLFSLTFPYMTLPNITDIFILPYEQQINK